MEFVPWTSFSRIVARYAGDSRAMVLPCSEHFRIMAYAQLTWRESLRDIEATLGANPSKLYGMGLGQAVHRSTLADANERRDWRIWSNLAAVLIRRARKLYAQEDLGLDVNIAGNVYALDSSTIDLCLTLWCQVSSRLSRTSASRAIQRPGLGKDTCVLDQQHGVSRHRHCPALQEPLAGGAVLQVDQTAPANQEVSGHQRERGEDANLGSAIATYVLIAIVKKELQLKTSLYTCLQILSVSVFEKTQVSCALRGDDYEIDPLPLSNQLILFNF